MKQLIKKFSKSTSSVLELRSKLYAPISSFSSEEKKTFNANGKKRIVEIESGFVIIKGTLLTQTHKDILDCMFSEAVDIKPTKSGGLAMMIPTDGLLEKYRGSEESDINWIKNKIDEIQVSAFEFKTKDKKNLYSFNIINSFAYKEDLGLYAVELSPDYCRFFEEQLSVGYKDEVEKLLKLDSPLAKAIVRYFWSYQSSITMTIDEVFEAVGYNSGASVKAKKMKKFVLISTISSMSSYGITYDAATESFSYEARALKNTVSFVSPAINRLPVRNKSTDKKTKPASKKTIEAIIIDEKKDEPVIELSREEREKLRLLNLPKDF